MTTPAVANDPGMEALRKHYESEISRSECARVHLVAAQSQLRLFREALYNLAGISPMALDAEIVDLLKQRSLLFEECLKTSKEAVARITAIAQTT